MPLAAQLVGSSTGAKARGFSHSHPTTRPIGTRHHSPSQTLLQIATIISGIAANRVHTLHGLAWRRQVSSDILNAAATRDMASIWPVLLGPHRLARDRLPLGASQRPPTG